MNLRFHILVPLLGLLSAVAFPSTGAAQFGQNKVQYRYFEWRYLTTEHFDIYYNQGGQAVADYAAEIAEDAYRDLTNRLAYSGSGDDPIIIVTYQSHNDFEQTNVTGESPEESVGGFTEFLRTRVVVPFDGDYERFRHVIHHELTHAMMLTMLYGQGFGAVLTGVAQARVPLWFTEGLAEFQSRHGLDLETEMFLRDAVVNDLLPEINRFQEMGYLGVYKCGQSVLYYIAHRYGDEKIGEILHKIRNMRDFDRALKASIGIDQEELSKRWRRFFKERYWPQVARLDPPDRISTQLTDHNKEFCFINNSPSLSPNGEWIAFLSDRSDYFDVYLMRTIDGKVVRRLVRGQKSGQFEELHWLRPGITWSPDGSQIALAAKAGAQDAIHIIDVATGKIKRSLKFASDGLFSPSWSPDGSKLAVVYVQDGRSDLAYIDLETESLRLLTSDVFDDADPSWSPDGTSLLFTSNRDRETLDTTGTDPQALAVHPVEFFDIYTITLEDRQIVRLTNDKHIIRSPIWTPLSNTILYISNLSGVFNLYVRNLTTGETRAVSNVVTGCLQPSTARKSHALAFTAYYDFGYDIYLMDDPFDSAGNLTPEVVSPAARVSIDPDTTHSPSNDAGDYSQFVFDRLEQVPEESVEEEPDSSRIVRRNREESGLYTNHPYKPKLSPDYVFFSAAYSPYFKMQGSGLILFSDVLGNHNLYLSADINRNTENSNFFLQYDYLARRADLGTGFYHFAYPFYSRGVVWRDRNFGLFAQTSYPLNRFNRFELSAEYSVIERSVLSASDDTSALEIRKSTVVPHIGYVHDTSIWRRSTAPSNGSRWRLDGSFSPDIGLKRDGVVYTTFTGDWRKYFAYKKDFTFAIRLSGGGSYGSDAQMFFLGGMQNWFNPNYDNPDRDVQIDDLKDIYYSSFVGPLRGVGYYNRTGNRYLLANAEFRYPFIRDLVMGWPLPIYIRDVQGALFTDWGSAWTPGNRQTINIDPPINVSGFSAAVGYGIGLRIDLGIFPLEMDVAWSPDDRVNMVPHYYFSINTGF